MSSPDNPQFESQPVDSVVQAQGGPLANDPALDPFSLPSPVPTPPPPRDPVWSGWDVLLIALLTVLSIIVISMVLGVGTHFLFPRVRLHSVEADIAVAAQFLAYLVVASFMVMLVQGKYHVPFWIAIRWNWPRPWIKFMGLGVLLLLAIAGLSHFLPMPKTTPFEELFDKPRDAYLIAAFAVTVGPLMEEVFFRGLLYPVLARKLGVFGGVMLTALLFGLTHMFQYGYAWGVVLLIFLMGVVCTIVRAETGSVASSFLVHVGYNATQMVLLILATDGFRHMEKAAFMLP